VAREIRVSRLVYDPGDYDDGDPNPPLGWWRTHAEAVRASDIAGPGVVVENVVATEWEDGTVTVDDHAILFGFANGD